MSGADARNDARPAAFAGGWYPRDRQALADAVDGYLAAQGSPFSRIVALVSPHAGLMYSGRIAGQGYAALRDSVSARPSEDDGEPLVAVLVGPSHYVGFEGVAVHPGGSFETPLGAHPVDADLVGRLEGASGVVHRDGVVHAREHSLELQLPFLTRVLPGVPIVPLLMGRQSRATVNALAADLSAALQDRRAVLVASSDLSHFHDRRTASELDAVVLDRVGRFDPDGLQEALDRFPHHACGGGPVVAVMRAARALGARSARVLAYGDSGDVSGDVERVVGYVSAVLGSGSEARP